MANQVINPPARNEKYTNATKILNEISSTNVEELSRAQELSPSINFSRAIPAIEEMDDVFRQLNDRDISKFASTQLDWIVSSGTELKNQIDSIHKFELNTKNPGNVCNGIIESIKNSYDGIISPLIIPLAFTATQTTNYQQIEREAKGFRTTMQVEAESFRTEMDVMREEAREGLQAIRTIAAEGGVARKAQKFTANADFHSEAADRWLRATAIAAGITGAVAIAGVVAVFYYHPETPQAAFQYVVAKLVAISILTYGLVWCSKNYRAHKHNQTLSQHRANALLTFRAFVEGTSDEKVNDALLLHAAQAAFAPRPTAYDNAEVDHQPINPVVEVFGKSLAK